MLPTALTVFLGAFLLFQVQPLIVRYILPWYGGGPAVWSTAMMFFQVMLVCGYVYAHVIRRKLSSRTQGAVHLVFLIVALTMLPIVPSDVFKETASEAPTTGILLLLLATIGLPFFVLAATSPLMQAWAVLTRSTNQPYRLYSLSNIGSLLALLSYPFLVEPLLGRQGQAEIWSAVFVVFAVLSAWVAIGQIRNKPEPTETAAEGKRSSRSGTLTIVMWVALPAVASILLLAITNQISQDVAVVPFLWIVPLSLYLTTFILVFANDRWYSRQYFLPALIPAMAGMIWMLFESGTASVLLQLGLFSLGLFVCCMTCHGELARLKPESDRLTEFYVWIAIGGAVGGLFVGIVAPRIFTDYLELHIGLFLCVALVVVALLMDRQSPLRGKWTRPILAVVAITYVGLSYGLTRHVALLSNSAVAKSRNFYGVLTVVRRGANSDNETLTLRNGMIDHGMQFTEPDRAGLPITYYAHQSGIGLAMRHFASTQPRRIGLVGLGIRTVAAYTRRSDTLRAYELNPQVTDMARTWFSYLAESPSTVQVVHGDARVSLERESPNDFDILVLDAFSGDAIPTHLLTEQAFQLYKRHLKPNGVLVVHLSNRHLDLTPVVRQNGLNLGWEPVLIRSVAGPNETWRADWMLMTNNPAVLEHEDVRSRGLRGETGRQVRPWTDDYSNLLSVMRPPW